MKKRNMHRQLFTWPPADHPDGSLEQAEYWKEDGACSEAGPEDIRDESRSSPGVSKRDIEDWLRELAADGYLERVSQDPETYRLTPAGWEALEAKRLPLGKLVGWHRQETIH